MAFCTAADLATRLGRAFTTAEDDMADMLCDAATAVIAQAADKDDAWAAALEADSVPNILKFVAVEVAARVMGNPAALRNASETLGAYQHSEGYQATDAGGGLLLTKTEELLVRRNVYGRTSGSSRPDSTATELHDLYYGDCS